MTVWVVGELDSGGDVILLRSIHATKAGAEAEAQGTKFHVIEWGVED